MGLEHDWQFGWITFLYRSCELLTQAHGDKSAR